MRKTTYLLFIVFSLLFSSGCLMSKKAVAVRTRLAMKTEQQLTTTAQEVEQLVKYTMAQQADQTFALHAQKYQTLKNSIRLQHGNDIGTLSDKSAKAGADYVRGEYKIKEELQEETERLYLMVYKIQSGAKAIDTVNKMANEEITIHDDILDQITESGLDVALQTLFTEIEKKYTPDDLKKEDTTVVKPIVEPTPSSITKNSYTPAIPNKLIIPTIKSFPNTMSMPAIP